MGTPFRGERLDRRTFIAGAVSLFALAKTPRAWAYDNRAGIETAQAQDLINNIDFVLQSLDSSDREMNNLIALTQKPGNVRDESRVRVEFYARDRIQRNTKERMMLTDLKQLKLWGAPQLYQEAFKVLWQIQTDAIVSNQRRGLARVDAFEIAMGVRAVS